MTTKPEAKGDFRIAPFEAWATIWKRYGVKVEKPGKQQGARLHVKNLAESVDADKLKTAFGKFGSVIEAGVKTDPSGKSKGFGFVIMKTEEEATKAVAEMNGSKSDGLAAAEGELAVVLVERKQGKGKEKGKGKGEADKGKGKGKKGEKGDAKGKGKKGKGKGAADYSMAAMSPYANPYAYYGYGMPPYGMFPPYMYGMPPYGYPMSPTYQAAAMGMFPGGQMPPTPTATTAATPAAETSTPAKGAKGKGKGKGKAAKETSAAVTKDPPPADKEFKGSLKSKSEKNGYGFIMCSEAKELYDRDVWVDGDALPQNVKEGDKLKFNITLSAKGHPQALNVKSA